MTDRQFQRLIVRLLRERSGSRTPILLLESQMRDHPASRRSLLALGSKAIITAFGDQIRWEEGGEERTFRQNPWDALGDFRRQQDGWLFGYFGYDLKNHLERLDSRNPDPAGAPDLLFFRPEELMVLDHAEGTVQYPAGESPTLERLAEVVAGSDAGDGERPGEAGDAGVPDEADGGLHSPAGGINVGDSPDGQALPDDGILLDDFSPLTPGDRYLEQIRQVQERIREGECYEVNLSHLLQGRFTGDPYRLYANMRREGPVPFGAFLRWDRWNVCCASPERFLCKQGQRLFSQPIKGTAPRMIDPEQDRKVREELLNSEKERAENLMIVDLVRHDLSKVTLPGTIRVPELFSLHRFETVHQLISTVEGRVEPDRDPVEIIRACFPMGSMTGAPKIRAMEVIEELEEYRRGIYSGAVGYMDPNGDFDFNVVIRTAILRDNRLFYPVGGAITSDSDPQQELEETWVKARALTRALHSV